MKACKTPAPSAIYTLCKAIVQCIHKENTMKFWHYYCIKSPLLLVGYLFGTQDPAFLFAAVLSALAIPLFAYCNE